MQYPGTDHLRVLVASAGHQTKAIYTGALNWHLFAKSIKLTAFFVGHVTARFAVRNMRARTRTKTNMP